ncbi:MAG: hypothetical protein HOP30_15105 [Cyclobacteriaceae bacterium]|nr:hypothetical protein [Cyclobacteriaceae bacterium]
MIATFKKIGKTTGFTSGDKFRSEYTILAENSTKCVFTFSYNYVKWQIDERTFIMKPVNGFLTIRKYLIVENGFTVGEFLNPKWGSLYHSLVYNNKYFTFKRIYDSFWERFFGSKQMHCQLQDDEENIYYFCTVGKPFDKREVAANYFELEGQIECSEENLIAAFLGLFILEMELVFGKA